LADLKASRKGRIRFTSSGGKDEPGSSASDISEVKMRNLWLLDEQSGDDGRILNDASYKGDFGFDFGYTIAIRTDGYDGQPFELSLSKFSFGLSERCVACISFPYPCSSSGNRHCVYSGPRELPHMFVRKNTQIGPQNLEAEIPESPIKKTTI
jgi:hypothetical protein